MSAAKDALYSDRAKRPPRPDFKPTNIPKSMMPKPRWVGWVFSWKNDEKRWAKIPLNPHTSCKKWAKPNDPETWSDFRQAATASNEADERNPRSIDGLGYMFDAEGDFGLDIDGCRNPETGELSELSASIVKAFGTYAEISPSGTGIKLFGRGSLPWKKGRKVKLSDGQELELYDRGRYFTVTGLIIPGCPSELADCSAPLADLIAKHFPDEKKGKSSNNGKASHRDHQAGALDDQQVINLICRGHSALWNGSTAGHGDDDSAADLALCNLIAFYIGSPDANRIDDIFRQSGLVRDKWTGRADYRAATIGKALENRTEYYSPGPRITLGEEYIGGGTPSANGKPPDDDEPKKKPGAEVILDFFRTHHKPVFRRKNSAVCKDGSELSRIEACSGAPFRLIALLSFASDAPTLPKSRTVDHDRLPAFFKKWVGTAWAELLDKLPDEDEADLGAVGEIAKEEFRRLVRQAMLTEILLGPSESEDPKNAPNVPQRRSLIEWCWLFAKLGRWGDIRSKRCWCKLKPGNTEGELVLSVAIRQELFSQIKADSRLIEMGVNTFTRRAERYGVGTSSRKERPEGLSVVVLDDEFVRDLIADMPQVEEAELFGSSEKAKDSSQDEPRNEDTPTPPTICGHKGSDCLVFWSHAYRERACTRARYSNHPGRD